MKLYHGSNVVVIAPKIMQSRRMLDFGKGFYLTSNFRQASNWAKIKAERAGVGKALVSVYEVDDNILRQLLILRFRSADVKWLQLVSAYRQGKQPVKGYDIIIDPVANDTTMQVINLYMSGMYSETEALKRLLPQKLTDQYAFKTTKAIGALAFSEVREV